MSNEYTAEDFAQARFAVHESGRALGIRWATDPGTKEARPWTYQRPLNPLWVHRANDGHMAGLGGWVPVEEAAAITLDDLAAAWEAAEVPTDDNPIREGDEIICLMGTGGYLLRRASVHEHGRVPLPSVRVLSRAPQREPWQDLADALGPVIAEANGGEDQRLTDEWAQRLYERGVRVSKNEQE